MKTKTALQMALAHNMTKDEYEKAVNILQREPNYLEIGIISAMWSEHCSYKSSTKYLRGFPTTAPWVIQGPGENAGVIDIGDDDAVVFKMESHNHPSFIEPYQGAATGVGGIMRDIFTMGARPIASLNLIQFAKIDDDTQTAKLHRRLLRGVVEGIGGYGNCMGVPTIGGSVGFEQCYAGNNLVNAFNLGIVKKDEIFLGVAKGEGNPVIYVGSKTGRDGLGGAVMSSSSFEQGNESLRPTVQVGDPFTEKLLLEACLELFKKDYIIGIQDMGAAGLTSSSFEMAGKSGSGMKLQLDKVPARESGMSGYDFMLSESQERMLICAKKGYEQKVMDIFHKWQLEAVVMGEVTNSGNMELFWENEIVAKIPISPLSEEAPVLDRPIKRPEYLDKIKDISMTKNLSLQTIFDKLFSSAEIVDKSWIYQQFDSMVQTNTIKHPGSLDSSVIRIKHSKKAISMSVGCNARYCYIDPKLGAMSAVMSASADVAMSGATPLAVTDCLNFGNPNNPEVMWQFKEACEGIKIACKELNTPVVSGNVSLNNETDGIGIYPTPAIGTVGVLEDQKRLLPSIFQNQNNYIFILGDTYSEFGGSLYLKEIEGQIAGTHPKVDLKKELTIWNTIIEANNKNLLQCAKNIGVGGLAISLAKMSVLSNIGCELDIALENDIDIFSESLSRCIVEVAPKDITTFDKFLQTTELTYMCIGKTGGDIFRANGLYKKLNDIKKIYFDTFQKIIEQDL